MKAVLFGKQKRRHDSPSHSLRIPVVDSVLDRYRTFRRWTSRPEWGRRLLGDSAVESVEGDGLVLIQIDGLSRGELERAVAEGKMPFLARLIEREGYEIHLHYSGVPSTSAATQAELFYGVKSPVAAYCSAQRTPEMIATQNQDIAAESDHRLAFKEGLLHEGSSYGNVFTGGAAEPHFSASGAGWGNLLRGVSRLRAIPLAMMHPDSIVRTAAHALIKAAATLTGRNRRRSSRVGLLDELKQAFDGTTIAALLRELSTISAAIDVARGMRVVQVSFLGFDEYAHRSGPDSSDARAALRGIDRCIRQVWLSAVRSERRHYQIWIYSDHGQTRATPYELATGIQFEQAVHQVFKDLYPDQPLIVSRHQASLPPSRTRYLRSQIGNQPSMATALREAATSQIVVAAAGSLGHIYLPAPFPSSSTMAAACRALASQYSVPLVLTPFGDGAARAWTATGEFELPDQRALVFGDDHPFLDDVAQDFISMCRDSNAGDIVIAGWSAGANPLTFDNENGSHGGGERDETSAFALLPGGTPLSSNSHFIRTRELRKAALNVLASEQHAEVFVSRPSSRDTIRVMTYNVHCCMGLDRRLSIRRIARVLAQCDADVIALQELDARRPRSGLADQSYELARWLGMEFHYFPPVAVANEAYGDAILSRLPMRLVRAGKLPGVPFGRPTEPRGAIWAELDTGSTKLQVINTHLGLREKERRAQVDALLGPDWLGHPACQDPVILCGDFNAGPGSQIYGTITARLKDSQFGADRKKASNTWISTCPVLRIDHIFLSPRFHVKSVQVPRSKFIQIASDHLPLLVDVQWGES